MLDKKQEDLLQSLLERVKSKEFTEKVLRNIKREEQDYEQTARAQYCDSEYLRNTIFNI